MSLLRILAKIRSEPWAIDRSTMDTIIDIADRQNLSPEAVAKELGRPLNNTYDVTIRDGVAILPIQGPLFRYANLMTQLSGATSYELLARDFEAALSNPQVKSILLNIDSPGGEASGVSEFADQIYQARGQKPVVAYVGGVAASAAYWLAAAADEIVISDTAILGSIGTVMTIDDTRAKDEKNGVKRHEIVSSQSPHKRLDPTTAAGQSRYQALVDSLSSVFIDKLATYRGTTAEAVANDFGQGDVLVGMAAVEAGLADRMGSFEATVSELSTRGYGPVKLNAAARGATTESADMRLFLTSTTPTAGDEQRTHEATAANIATLCPEAAEQLRQEGAAATAAATGTATADAVAADRTRVQAILASTEADGRGELAQHLAFSTEQSAEQAIALLAKSPKTAPVKADPLAALMGKVTNPAVGADTEQGDAKPGDLLVNTAKQLGLTA